MKIAIIGTQNTGKTTLIEEFIKQWPMYKRPEKTYRDFIKNENLALNKSGTSKSQRKILDALIDEVQTAVATGEDFLIFDRCVVDNIVYSLWHHAKGTEGFSREYIIEAQSLAVLSLKYYDIIFYLPVRSEIPIEDKENRDIDATYREEIDNIYQALLSSYEKGSGAFFPREDCPAVIRLEGPPDMRIPQIRLYIKDNGKSFGEEDGSLIAGV